MAELRLEDVIRRPLITEKNTMLMEIGQYTFEVAPEANKIQIKEAVETDLQCPVKAVNTLNVKPKKKSRIASRRGGRIVGHEAGWKKAIVTLAPGRSHRHLRADLGEDGSRRQPMPIRKYKPTSPGRRSMSVSTLRGDHEERAGEEPDRAAEEEGRAQQPAAASRPATVAVARSGSIGSSTSSGTRLGVPAKVAAIEYDPNRSARIALLFYVDGEKRYMLAPLGLKVGDTVVAGPDAPIRVGNALPLRNIPVGTQIHNIELRRGGGGQLVRSAGTSAQLMAKAEDYAQIRMPSGEVRRVHLDCMATLGQVGNVDHENVVDR